MDSADGDTHDGESWRGVSMEEIHRFFNEFELDHVPAVAPGEQHTVLHHFPIRGAETEPPRPLKMHPKWDALHVRMPCSVKSQYPVTAADGTSSIESRWEMIEQALRRPINDSHALQQAILSYNTKYEGRWNFRALHKLFEDDLDDSEGRVFFEDLLPRIIRLALKLPEIVQAPVPLLKQNQSHSLTLTQQQISCLLANAFLCTFPRRNTLKQKSEYSTFPDINFNRLFQSSGQAVLEKIKSICHYFRRVCPTERDSSNVPTGVVTFTRRSLQLDELPNWAASTTPLSSTPLHITSTGTIEDQGLGLLQVDFANKYLGGGVLGSGCVQEEIRFVICPELLVAKLFTECLRPTEALVMVGCERYSNYTGYASSFQWAGNHDDVVPRDSSRRRMTHIVAIDALAFRQSDHQYREQLMQRELNKAYVGFLHPLSTPAPGVASGNWGCGAFGGDATLKALLQLMVCAVTDRPLVYYTFGNESLRDEVFGMYQFFEERNVCVQDLWATLRKFEAQRLAPKELYNFIYSCLGDDPKHSLTTRTTPAANSEPAPADPSSTSTTAYHASSTGKMSGSNTKPSLNVSEDIFAVDSDSDSVGGEQVLSPTESAASAQLTRNEEGDADCSPPETKERPIQGTPTNPARTASRQRTLLEMLDQCYTNGPATKRHCAGRTPTGAQKPTSTPTPTAATPTTPTTTTTTITTPTK